MRLTHDTVSETGLQLFAKTCISISHETKNALAIMKENAGLAEALRQELWIRSGGQTAS